jgi:vesicle-associated membrane protein 7
MLLNSPEEKINAIYYEIDKTKNEVQNSMSLIIDRGEKLDYLVDKSDNLNENSRIFKMQARRLKRKMFWKRVKITLLLLLILLIIILIFVFSICGFKFNKC